MKRILKIAGLALLVLLVTLAGFVLWASSGPLPEDQLATTKTYGADYAPPRDTLTVMTYNIGYLSGMTNNEPVERSRSLFVENMDQAAALIRRVDPDIVGFQEIDLGAARSFGIHQLDTLATRLGFPAAAQAVNWNVRYLPFPYGWPSVHFGRVVSGQAVLSRYPIAAHRRIELVRPPLPLYEAPFYLDRLAQVAVLDVGGDSVAVINVHLDAFDETTREKQASEVSRLVGSYLSRAVPVLLIGDFNSVMPAAKSALPPVEQARFVDDQTMLRITSGVPLLPAIPENTTVTRPPRYATFPADEPTRKIDYVFYTSGPMQPVEADVVCGDASSPPSDHCAVTMKFVLLRPETRPGGDRSLLRPLPTDTLRSP